MSEFFSFEYWKNIILWIPVILLSISFHEFAHGWAADKLGDPTARYAGRLTLNPMKHFNLLGFLMMLIIHFGWATPVPVNPNNFKKPRQGMLYTALAGPIANLILAVVSSLLYAIVWICAGQWATSEFTTEVFLNLLTLLIYMVYINIGLAVFNLIPIEPLDGSRILGYFMPVGYHNFMAQYGQYVHIGFVLLLLCTSVISGFIGAVQSFLGGGLIHLWSLLLQCIINLF